jgi:hypothetical protein
MHWTTKMPDKPGWWWMRESPRSSARIVRLYWFRVGVLCWNDEDATYLVDYYSHEWSSEPIPVPAESPEEEN